ncbi:hypothetical protein CLV62_1251, partial [Dysgonomonas alginatilytica]
MATLINAVIEITIGGTVIIYGEGSTPVITQQITQQTTTTPANKAVSDALAKKADIIRAADSYKVAYSPDGTIPSVDLTPYAKTTTAEGTVVRTVDGKIPIVDISGKVDKTVIYNVSQASGNYAYADKTTARNAVTTTLRALGQIIIYSYGSNGFVLIPFTNIGNYVINAATGVQAASPNHIAHSAAIPTGTKQIELQVFTSSANGGAFFNAS